MKYKIELSKKAVKEFRTYTKRQQQKVLSLLEELQTQPYLGRKLVGNYAHLYSLRVNLKDRIVYEVREEQIIIYVLRVKTHYGD